MYITQIIFPDTKNSVSNGNLLYFIGLYSYFLRYVIYALQPGLIMYDMIACCYKLFIYAKISFLPYNYSTYQIFQPNLLPAQLPVTRKLWILLINLFPTMNALIASLFDKRFKYHYLHKLNLQVNENLLQRNIQRISVHNLYQ